MKMKKFLLCMTTALLVGSTVSTNAFAAEVNTVVQTQNSEAENETKADPDTQNVETVGLTEDKKSEEVKIEETAEGEDTTNSASHKEDKKSDSKTDKKEKKENVQKTEKKVTKVKKAAREVYSKADLRLLSAIIYCEAGGQSYAGKLGVGIVVMNRVENKAFPNTVKGVIYQKSQFGPVRNGSLNRALKQYDSGKFTSAHEKQCIKAAKEALSGTKEISYTQNGKVVTKSLQGYYFFSGRLSNPRFVLGGHQFK